MSRTAPDLAWAIARLQKNQAIAEANAGRYGEKLLKGHGYPDEVMGDAQDALAYRLVLSHVGVLVATLRLIDRDDVTSATWDAIQTAIDQALGIAG